MVPVVEEHIDEIAELCRCNKVKRLELFGSALKAERFDVSGSDLDFVVDFLPESDVKKGFFALLLGLEDIFSRKIDLVMARAIKNRFFKQVLDQQKELVYGA